MSQSISYDLWAYLALLGPWAGPLTVGTAWGALIGQQSRTWQPAHHLFCCCPAQTRGGFEFRTTAATYDQLVI
eukprot:6175477-Pleurochrysis_carterae.AAC.1